MKPDFRPIPPLVCRLALLLVVSLAGPAFAGPGHDGGHESDETPSMTADPAPPRFEARSDLFEVVGTASHGELSLTLDTYATNEPVAEAQMELESGAYKATGVFILERGVYRFASSPFDKPGTYPVTLTITAGNEIDLLAADLVVRPALTASLGTGTSGPDRRLWWGVGGIAAVLALAFGLRRRRAAA